MTIPLENDSQNRHKDRIMILCLCRAVSETQVSDCIAAGATNADEVTRRCGAGGDCGSCLMDIESRLAESSARRIGVAA
jgi:bacterioferritin-associated ferredoxin